LDSSQNNVGAGIGAASQGRSQKRGNSCSRTASVTWGEEVDEDEGNTGSRDQQELIKRLLATSSAKTQKIVATLREDVSKRLDELESRVDQLKQSNSSEIEKRLEQVQQVKALTYTLYLKLSDYQMERVQEQITELSTLTEAYSHLASADKQGVKSHDAYLQMREDLCRDVSFQGANVAMRQQQHFDENQKIHVSAKAFAEAHRDFFRALEAANSSMVARQKNTSTV